MGRGGSSPLQRIVKVGRVRDLCASAVEAALAAGASYADARALVRRNQTIATKNGRVEAVRDVESEGIGVRVLVGGAWGFASDRRLTQAGAAAAAQRAGAFARVAPGSHERRLAPVPPAEAGYPAAPRGGPPPGPPPREG